MILRFWQPPASGNGSSGLSERHLAVRTVATIIAAATLLAGTACSSHRDESATDNETTPETGTAPTWSQVPDSLTSEIIDGQRWTRVANLRCPVSASIHRDARHFAVSDCDAPGIVVGIAARDSAASRQVNLRFHAGGASDHFTALAWDDATGQLRGYAMSNGALVAGALGDSTLDVTLDAPQLGGVKAQWASQIGGTLVAIYPERFDAKRGAPSAGERSVVVRMRTRMAPDTLARLVGASPLTNDDDGAMHVWIRPYGANTLWLAERSSTGFVLRTDSARVTPVRLIDDVREHPWSMATPGPAVTANDRKRIVDSAPKGFRTVVRADIPRRWPAVRSALVDGDHVWIAVRRGDARASVPWRSYDAKGQLTGSFEVADSLEVLAIRDTSVLVAHREGRDMNVGIVVLRGARILRSASAANRPGGR